MDGRRMTTWVVALLATAIGLEWLISDANAFGRRRRCCCEEQWTCCGGEVAYDPCATPHMTRHGGYEYGDADYGWEGYEYSGEPMMEPYGDYGDEYYDESVPGMERPQYETGQRPPRPSTPEPAVAPQTDEQGQPESMRSMEEEPTEEPLDTTPESEPGVSGAQDTPPAPAPPSPEESETTD